VIHCAAKVGGVKANTDFVADFFDDNIRMNMNVLEGCKRAGVKLVSVLSTCVYPDSPYVKYPLTEDQLHMGPPHHSNFGYAYAKRMLEVQSRAYRQQFGCNFISVIPNNLYGLNDNYHLESGHVIPALIRKFYVATLQKEESVTVWGSGRPLREFTFARDAAKIILWLAENYNGESPVNIGNPEQVSISDLAQIISEEVGFSGKIIFDTTKPDGQFKKPSSNQKLRDLGWNGNYTPLREGLRETIKFFEENYPNVRGV
jgi:GDP-L-fucose synthase